VPVTQLDACRDAAVAAVPAVVDDRCAVIADDGDDRAVWAVRMRLVSDAATRAGDHRRWKPSSRPAF
jgi:hypothetical protein